MSNLLHLYQHVISYTCTIKLTAFSKKMATVVNVRDSIPSLLEGLRNENDFELFWQKIENMRVQFDIDEPLLPRKRKVPQRFARGIAPAEFATSPKDEYRRVFFECFDLAVMSIRSRFDQKGFKTFSNVEQLLFKACKGQNYEEELDFVHV